MLYSVSKSALTMKAFRISMAIFTIVLALAETTYGQCVIRGRVVDTKRRPVAGVNVLVKGTQLGTVTDENGYFQLSTTDDNVTLLIALNGKRSVERKVADVCLGESVQVIMQESRRRR
jgi:hypothetical protein